MLKILIVEDDITQRMMLSKLVKRQLNHDVVEAGNGQEALFLLKEDKHQDIMLVLMDLYMPIMDGRETLEHIKTLYPNLAVIMVSASEELKDAVELMQMGASDFITKPYELERMRVSIENVLRLAELSDEVQRLHRKKSGQVHFHDMIGANSGLRQVVELAEKSAQSDIPTYIHGESGVGKELLARAIHGSSDRNGKPFIAINCGAIPENLVESTLFGHKKGSFTGAVSDQKGKFLSANGGTLFLDEVGELPLEMQVKLLRALQQKEIEPVGEGKPVPVDVRIISATNRDISEAVSAGDFREDLYYRLNVFPVTIPPLRERRQDISHMVDFFLKRFCAIENKPIKHLTPDVYALLEDYHWPGNVRELENAVFRAVVVSDQQELTTEDFAYMVQRQQLSADIAPGDVNITPEVRSVHSTQIAPATTTDAMVTICRSNGAFKTMDEIEWDTICKVLDHYDGDVKKTAYDLGIGQSTLYRKISAHKH